MTTSRPGGAPFMDGLPASVVERYEREQAQRTASVEETPEKRYLRVGPWRDTEESWNFAKGGFEPGVSVYDLDEHDQPITPPDGEWAQADLDDRMASEDTKHIVTGREVGRGGDGEPLLKDLRILGEHGSQRTASKPSWVEYDDLPEHAQAAVHQYMSEGEWDHPEQMEAQKRKVLWQAEDVPTEEVKRRVMAHPEIKGDWGNDWDAYHHWYRTSAPGGTVDHGKSRWSVIENHMGDDGTGYLEDGWHRLHSYVAAGHPTIPVVRLRDRKQRTASQQPRPGRSVLYRAEGPQEGSGYAGDTDERTGRYFGNFERASQYLDGDRHLYEVHLSPEETWDVHGAVEDHVLLSAEQAARKVHSDRCTHPDHQRD